MKFVIDKFESNYAVIEIDNKTIISLPKVIIPKEAKEGTVLEIKIDETETKKRKKDIGNLMNELFKG